ncbi:MAG TPA: cell division topological specificity factor MinE [Xanthobacteraceae bacterium]|jgi:cell division topological specificity factor|nr:cell division topological specificity factor MinE [Xanthobacteraceae bacterium]
MKLFQLFGRRSAPQARERLQILLTHERGATGQSGLIAMLREDILGVIAKHVEVAPERVEVRLERGDEVAILEINVEIPDVVARAAMARQRGGRAA